MMMLAAGRRLGHGVRGLLSQQQQQQRRQPRGVPLLVVPRHADLASLKSTTIDNGSTSTTNTTISTTRRFFHSATIIAKEQPDDKDDLFDHERIQSQVSHNFPDFIEHWDREAFRKVGYGLTAATAVTLVGPTLWLGTATAMVPGLFLGTLTAVYWHIGRKDMAQKSHAIRRNFPVLGNLRYVLETIRPELHQYIVESDSEGRPFDRNHRAQVYRRSKGVDDTLPFGTRRNVYDANHEWACHSMWPSQIAADDEAAKRYTIGTAAFGTTQPYHASVLNVSGMSYGAISDHAILALNNGARMGHFFQNTGEGGVSRFHIQGGGDLVWNIGTGYFGCGSTDNNNQRVFDPAVFQETLQTAGGNIKMIEIKLSQGAKPGHGGILPRAKITAEIAATRKLEFPATDDCHSPPRHSAFNNAHEMIEFIQKVREYSGGLPVGVKLCVGEVGDIAMLCKAMVELHNGPDFITVDGAEGGTGAAPPEFSNSVGMPLEEGIVVVRNMLVGAGLKDKVAMNASGRITTGFSLVRNLALGADICSAARAFMLSLGCIQALKCNTNKCPTGIATLDKKLMYGLDPELKSTRVYNFHKKTLQSACEIVGILGKDNFHDLSPNDIMRRVASNNVRTLSELFPEVEPGSLLNGTATSRLQTVWDESDQSKHVSSKAWIY